MGANRKRAFGGFAVALAVIAGLATVRALKMASDRVWSDMDDIQWDGSDIFMPGRTRA